MCEKYMHDEFIMVSCCDIFLCAIGPRAIFFERGQEQK
jgi:hypothetical protein